MANVYLGSTPLSNGKLGDTSVSKIYLGDQLIWPSGYQYALVDDDFLTDTRANYTITGGALEVASSKLQIPASGPATGTREVVYGTQLNSDDMIVRFKTGSALNTRFSSLMVRESSSVDRYVGLHFTSSNCYLQRVRASDGNIADFASTTMSTTLVPIGGWIDLMVVGNRYQVIAYNASGVPNGRIDFTDTGNIVQTGSGYRYAGMRIERVSTTNSPSSDQFTAYSEDGLAHWPRTGKATKNGNMTYGTANVWQQVTGILASTTEGGSNTGVPDSVVSGNALVVSHPGKIRCVMHRDTSVSETGMQRCLRNGTVVWTSPSVGGDPVTQLSDPFDVQAGDLITWEINFTTTGTLVGTSSGFSIFGVPPV